MTTIHGTNAAGEVVRFQIEGDTFRAVYSDALVGMLPVLGDAAIRRASHVEPRGLEWIADMSPMGGPVLAPFATRQAALDAERAWLRETYGL